MSRKNTYRSKVTIFIPCEYGGEDMLEEGEKKGGVLVMRMDSVGRN